MLVYLIRHGKAGTEDPQKWPNDEKRPLTAQGKLDFARVAKGIGRTLADPVCVYTSPALRCSGTAKILKAACGWGPVKEAGELDTDADEKDACDLIDEFCKDYGDDGPLCFVGHESQLEALIAELTGDSAELRRGGVAVLDYDKGRAKLKQLLKPSVLRILAK